MSEELKPCPFCGTTEGLYPSHHWPGTGKPYAIDCIGCGMDFTPREGMDVVSSWNRRDPDAVKDAEMEKLKAELASTYEELIDHTGDDMIDTRARRVAALKGDAA